MNRFPLEGGNWGEMTPRGGGRFGGEGGQGRHCQHRRQHVLGQDGSLENTFHSYTQLLRQQIGFWSFKTETQNLHFKTERLSFAMHEGVRGMFDLNLNKSFLQHKYKKCVSTLV